MNKNERKKKNLLSTIYFMQFKIQTQTILCVGQKEARASE